MANAEQIFNNCTLELIVPNGVLQLPTPESGASAGDEWLKQAHGVGERRQAFFDEKLDLFLTVCFKQESSADLLSPDQNAPPVLLLSFLSHLQVALEATYIPPSPQEQSLNVHLPAPPVRSSSSTGLTPRAKGLGVPLPIFPPQTPSPKPTTSETDKKYVYSEGTLLKSFIWGEDATDNSDAFRFLRSSNEKCWLAIYKISLPVVYVRTEFNDPLLCLTTSITLRDKPLPPTPLRQSLLELIKDAGHLPPLIDPLSSKVPKVAVDRETDITRRLERGFLEEVNLFEGLSSEEINVSGAVDGLYLPTSRIGASARRAYSLPPITPASPTDPVPSPSRSLPTLRKSYRKTLGLASGFFVRMRTIIVPQLFLPEGTNDEQEASGDESTVVLSIEIENPGDSDAAFSVDAIDVYLKNEASKIRMIGWGEGGFADPSKVFPLLIRPAEQYYLLYAVTFLRSPELDLSQNGEREYTKMVSFNIIGRPFTVKGSDFASMSADDELLHITSPFLSRWNCRLDLDPRRRESMPPPDTTLDGAPNAIPVPPSPFPAASPRAQQAQEQASALSTAQLNITAGPKRHTFAGTTSPHLLTPQRPMSLNTSPLGTPGTSRQPSPLSKLGMKPWSVGSPLSTPGHLSPPLPPLPNGFQNESSPPPTVTSPSYSFPAVPPTPAFPSYGNQPLTPRPNSVTPSLGQMGSVGLGIDARRERLALPGMPLTPMPPMTPRPQIGIDERAMPTSFRAAGNLGDGSKDFIISISIVPPSSQDEDIDITSSSRSRQQLIRPLNEFSLEIFVFNQSPYIRTLEATLTDNRRRRDEKRNSYQTSSTVDSWKPAAPAFMALESRVRIGPLGPSTCQSVTMRFLAMLPGVHTIDGLTLTDLDTGESISLRSVMDFAVVPRNSDS